MLLVSTIRATSQMAENILVLINTTQSIHRLIVQFIFYFGPLRSARIF